MPSTKYTNEHMNIAVTKTPLDRISSKSNFELKKNTEKFLHREIVQTEALSGTEAV